jgi:hypothetical protein
MRTLLILIAFAVLVDALAFDGRIRYTAMSELQTRSASVAQSVHGWIQRTFVL